MPAMAKKMVHAVTGVLLAVFFGWQALLLALLIPDFIAGAIGSYLFYVQHNFPGVSFNATTRRTETASFLE